MKYSIKLDPKNYAKLIKHSDSLGLDPDEVANMALRRYLDHVETLKAAWAKSN